MKTHRGATDGLLGRGFLGFGLHGDSGSLLRRGLWLQLAARYDFLRFRARQRAGRCWRRLGARTRRGPRRATLERAQRRRAELRERAADHTRLRRRRGRSLGFRRTWLRWRSTTRVLARGSLLGLILLLRDLFLERGKQLSLRRLQPSRLLAPRRHEPGRLASRCLHDPVDLGHHRDGVRARLVVVVDRNELQDEFNQLGATNESSSRRTESRIIQLSAFMLGVPKTRCLVLSRPRR
ncbi:hypothetical protein EXIGLDRAFT_175303 [Exidia glandulosa HHB12029]|uniref:Uncharacterized protein n=1 Tax=Exidia glandulosa HHB12029 TaxID=1314781 RepID=A0A165F5R5_EXIGL|nr:hypothetical protein EXIGLDRAFT_175303 [Exidia glandulosa HHB12029]